MERDEDQVSASDSPDSFQTALENGIESHAKIGVLNNQNTAVPKCLDILEKIVCQLKSETNSFMNILEKLLAIVEGDTGKMEPKLNLIDIVMSNIMDINMEELTLLNQRLNKLFHQKINKELVVDDTAIKCLLLLGGGAFGIVFRGLLAKPGKPAKNVAIKKSKQYDYNRLIEHEALIMCQLNHDNILKIFAVNKSTTAIAIELMELGNLVEAIERFNFSKVNLLKILQDVARGMDYLTKKKYLHRDLACRNVFLNARKQCKIGDFGFSVYVGDTNGVYLETVHDPHGFNLSPETLLSKEFTVANEVWAMGILCWELFYMFQHANKLPPASFTKQIHLEQFRHTRVQLTKPGSCPRPLYLYIINSLLNEDPKTRPVFSSIKNKVAVITDNEHF